MLSKEAVQELQNAIGITQATSAIAGLTPLGIIALPATFNVHDLEKYMVKRRHARGVMVTEVGKDFARYVVAHKECGAEIFIDVERMSAEAVLNLGEPDNPGHADNRAVLALPSTAAYTALLAIADGRPRKQSEIAEFFEDWSHAITCKRDDKPVPVQRAVAAIRSLNIEAMRKLASTEQNLSASKTTFEKVEATSDEPIPTELVFTCTPYKGIGERNFGLRLSIITNGDKPAPILRVIKKEWHDEEMGLEFADLVLASNPDIPVCIGKYTATR